MPDSRLPVIYVSAHVVDECKWATNVYSCKVQKHQTKNGFQRNRWLSICPCRGFPPDPAWLALLAKCRRRCNEVCRFFLISDIRETSGDPVSKCYINSLMSNIVKSYFCLFLDVIVLVHVSAHFHQRSSPRAGVSHWLWFQYPLTTLQLWPQINLIQWI